MFGTSKRENAKKTEKSPEKKWEKNKEFLEMPKRKSDAGN
jgi:hypothetical protein